MDARNHIDLSARADLYLCLARAFMTPCGDALARAMRDDLADDLEELGMHLGLEIATPLAAYRAAMQALQQPLELLQVYSAIFLAPPVVARINAGQYLDGALNGGSVRAMEEAYHLCGVARDDGFHDLADHVSVQLEFVALLYAGQAARSAGEADDEPLPVDAGRFLHAFAMRWVGRFRADLAAAAAARELSANPYLPLAEILEEAVTAHAVAPEVDPKVARKQGAIEAARAKYAARGITAEDMAEIRRKLEARGLSTDHLSTPPGLRGAPMGAVKKDLPRVR
jgi:TorA maturation chaperone TorD